MALELPSAPSSIRDWSNSVAGVEGAGEGRYGVDGRLGSGVVSFCSSATLARALPMGEDFVGVGLITVCSTVGGDD